MIINVHPAMATLLKALSRPLKWFAPLLVVANAAWAALPDVLPPEQAFRFTARMADPETVELRYAIADGYYLYRDKFKFTSETPGITANAPSVPEGKVKQDEFFGAVQTLRGDVTVRIPLTAPRDADVVKLKSQFQGCADAGICYTPQTRWSTLKLALADTVPATDTGEGVLSKLKRLSGMEAAAPEPEFLPVEQAFRVNVKAKDAQTLVAEFRPAEGYYLYRDKTSISIPSGKGVTLEKFTLPRGERKSDPNFGDTEVFHHAFQGTALLKRTSDQRQSIAVDVKFQGCSKKGLCYPPTTQRLLVALAALPSAAQASEVPPRVADHQAPAATESAVGVATIPVPGPPAPNAVTDADKDETTQISALFREKSFWGVIVSFFGFGLLLALTPCVFPMIPILSGIIVGQGRSVTRAQSLILSAVYVLGMAITYAIAGIAAGLSGSLLSSALQNPWVLGGFALVFVALALSMFGFYDMQLPTALQSRVATLSNRQRAGTLGGVFVMGVLSALIVGPCVAAPLAGALVYIGQSRDVVLGGSALFAMALGMGAPLLLVGWSAGTLLPRTGAWMQSVKNFCGVLLLAVAIWMVTPVLPEIASMLLWAALLIVSAVYLHAIDPLPPHASGYRKLWKGIGVIALLLGVALLVGALSGGRDPLQPLAGLRAQGLPAATAERFETVSSVADLDRRIATAGGRPVLLDFYADWCVSCKEMERYTFNDPAVKSVMDGFVLLRADVTRNTPEDAALLSRFGLFGPPGIIFYDRTGRQLPARVVGYQSAEKFLRSLSAVMK